MASFLLINLVLMAVYFTTVNAGDSMVMFACSDLAGTNYENNIDEIEKIAEKYKYDVMEMSNYIVAVAFERCVSTLPHNMAVAFLNGGEFGTPDPVLLKYADVSLSPLKEYNLDLEINEKQLALIDEFTKEAEKLNDPENRETQRQENHEDTKELVQQEVNFVTMILGVIIISSIALIGGICYFLSEK
jgi:hypothetical protein